MLKPSLRNWLLLAFVVVILDQLSKWLILQHIPYDQYHPVTVAVLPFLNLTHVYNPGAAFSFLADAGGWQRHFFSALAVLASGFIIVMLKKNPQDKLLALALSLILGGAIGNLVDRLLLGHVLDFIDVWWGGHHFPAFNVADSAITLGAILMVWDAFFVRKPQAAASTHSDVA